MQAVLRCFQHKVPAQCCVPVSEVVSWQHLRSTHPSWASTDPAISPQRTQTSDFRRTFAVAGPTFWNSLTGRWTYSIVIDLRQLWKTSFRHLLAIRSSLGALRWCASHYSRKYPPWVDTVKRRKFVRNQTDFLCYLLPLLSAFIAWLNVKWTNFRLLIV